MEPTEMADPLAAWRDNITIRPVLADQHIHSLHAYFGVTPESPDGQSVAVFVSGRPDGHVGRLLIVDRTSGETKTVDDALEVEDPHRQANQQWVCGGEFLVYMALRDGEWVVVRADPVSLSATVLCTGRQLGWGRPYLEKVPLYGPHWNPTGHRDVELLNIRTGEIRTVLFADRVLSEHASFVDRRFGQHVATTTAVSLFFPTLSPDGRRLFLKLAVANDGKFRSPGGSVRDGLLIYDLSDVRPVAMSPHWSHPCWYEDSRHILQRHTIFDVETATTRPIPNLAPLHGSHAAPSPDSMIMAADFVNVSSEGHRGRWRLMLLDLNDGRRQTIHVAPECGDGTKSWRKTHPHPSFNALGNRIYFNVNLGTWSALHVAEVPN